MPESIIVQECLNILKRDSIKTELNNLSHIIVDYVTTIVRPYIFIIVVFFILLFIVNIIHLILIIFAFRKLKLFYKEKE